MFYYVQNLINTFLLKKNVALKQFKELAIFIEISKTINDCRDPKDNKFLELAASANAS
jgi:predicted nucleic acid-binding protein